MENPLDPARLERYTRRIGYLGPLEPTESVLRALHRAHVERIPFENLAPRFGHPVPLDLPSLVAKLVDGSRGGYCFEHNGLFAAVLETLGYGVTRLAARVQGSGPGPLPRTHALLAVEAGGRRWLADTGFGGRGLLEPLPLEEGAEVRVGPWCHRLECRDGLWTLLDLEPAGWQALYSFDLQPQLPVDLELANWYTSTHPDSLFRRVLVAQRVTGESRVTLRDRELSEDRGAGPVIRRLDNAGDLRQVLGGVFGLALPDEPGLDTI